MELRERVAKAIYEEDEPWHTVWPWPNPKDGGAEEIREIADAAIAAVLDAMQEPNTATLQAGADRLFGAANDDWTVDAKEVWQAMLDAFTHENGLQGGDDVHGN